MNLLFDQLPTAVEIDGKEFAVNSDFRTCLRIIAAYEDNSLAMNEKHSILLGLMYQEQPIDQVKAIQMGMKFLNGGVDQSESADGPRLYSFQKDQRYIFAAFRQTHGIDLEITDMHWWKFLALFMDLGSDTTFCNLVSLRKRIADGTATKEERKAASDLGALIEVEKIDYRSIEEREKEAEFMRLLNGGK